MVASVVPIPAARARAAIAVISCVLAAAVLAIAVPARGSVPPADPIGKLWSVTAHGGGVRMAGWAADPNALSSNVTVVGYVDGRKTAAATPTNISEPRVAARYHTGPTPGFSLDVPVPSTGHHTACLVARGLGPGLDSVVGCAATPLGTGLSAGQVAAHSPQGAILRARVLNGKIRVHGWATDPDEVTRRVVAVMYVDGAPAQTLDTSRWTTPRPAGAGSRSAFWAAVPTSAGAHVACSWAVNVGFGHSSFLGCRTLDTRGPAGTGNVAMPRLNQQVVGEAKRHLGEPYVWGAAGPSQFDCSGLVMYSYGKFGYSTPRVSEDQFAVARLIPASRAVPGDLVFYHDSVGDVYHVGIYTGPGMSIAAIDPQDGVNWQPVDESSWDVTFGSFTHT